MRKLLTGLVVAAATAAVPVFALAGNQEVADKIAGKLRDGGQLRGYQIGVKYQDGTAWLKGRVRNPEQMNAALKTVFQTPGVTRVVNDLTIGSPDSGGQLTAGTTARFGKVQDPPSATRAEGADSIRSNEGAIAPDQMSTAKRLQRVVDGGNRAPAQALAVTAKPATGFVQRVASSFVQTPAEPTASMAPQETAETTLPVTTLPVTTLPVTTLPVTTAAAPRIPGRPIPIAYMQPVGAMPSAAMQGGPIPAYVPGTGGGVAPARYDQPSLPNYSWPSYAAHPNYAGLTYPRQYSPTAWPFIGPFYPYPQVPLGWRKVTLEWDDGWWMLDFEDTPSCSWWPHH